MIDDLTMKQWTGSAWLFLTKSSEVPPTEEEVVGQLVKSLNDIPGISVEDLDWEGVRQHVRSILSIATSPHWGETTSRCTCRVCGVQGGALGFVSRNNFSGLLPGVWHEPNPQQHYFAAMPYIGDLCSKCQYQYGFMPEYEYLSKKN